MVASVLNTYDRQAPHYDLLNSSMEMVFSRARQLFGSLWGDILEVGVGTGLNLPYYSPRCRVTVLDLSPQMVNFARQRVQRMGLSHVKAIRVGDIQDLSGILPDSFDFVTSSCVFCSVLNPIKALEEIARVLRPRGYFIQIEHGKSKIKLLNQVLGFFDPLMVKMKGAHLTRDHENNLKQAGFDMIKRRELDPAGITRIIISRPLRSLDNREKVN